MSWGMPETAKKLASGWYSELDTTREINADLGRENAKLRKEGGDRMSIHAKETDLQYWSDFANRDGVCFHKEDAYMLVREHHELENLKAENDKLRRLVADLWNWLAPTATTSAAPLKELHSRMSELGVEVE